MPLTLTSIQKDIHQNALNHGWWDSNRSDGEIIALIHAEASECLEALREGNPQSKHIPNFSSAEEELADIIIRVLDFAEAKNWNVLSAVIEKHLFNLERPFKHGGKLF